MINIAMPPAYFDAARSHRFSIVAEILEKRKSCGPCFNTLAGHAAMLGPVPHTTSPTRQYDVILALTSLFFAVYMLDYYAYDNTYY